MIETGGSRRLVLLDTNVLLLFFVGLVDPELIPRFKRTCGYTPDDFETLKSIVNQFDGIATTPHILAEFSNLADHLKGAYREDCFNAFVKALPQLAETHQPASDLANDPSFVRLGLTDIGIGRLASGGSLFVITVDLDLHLHLQRLRVSSLNLNEVSAVAKYVEELSL